MIDPGESYTTSYSSMPVGATSVTVTITLPDGTVGAPVSAPSGSYSYLTTVPGRHQATWQSTTVAGGTDRFTDVFDVAEQASSALVSLADVRAHLNLTSTRDDEELRLFIEAATGVVEHVVGPVTQTTHTEIVEATETIVLAKAPVLSLTSVVQTFPYLGLPLTTPQYLLDGPAGLLRMQPWTLDMGFAIEPFWGFGGQRLTVTYTTGRPSIPAAIRLAALIIIRHLWETQRMAAAGPLQQDAADEQQVGDMKIPSRAYELLEPYRRAPVIA